MGPHGANGGLIAFAADYEISYEFQSYYSCPNSSPIDCSLRCNRTEASVLDRFRNASYRDVLRSEHPRAEVHAMIAQLESIGKAEAVFQNMIAFVKQAMFQKGAISLLRVIG